MRTYEFEAQPMAEYGYKDIGGHVWCNSWVNSYNQLTKDINKTANKPVKSGSLTMQERDFLLDQRHRMYVQFMMIGKES